MGHHNPPVVEGPSRLKLSLHSNPLLPRPAKTLQSDPYRKTFYNTEDICHMRVRRRQIYKEASFRGSIWFLSLLALFGLWLYSLFYGCPVKNKKGVGVTPNMNFLSLRT